MITQEFNLNLIPSSPPVVVHVDQYDHGTGRLVASLYDGDTPYVPTNPSVYIQGTKPDGKYFISSTGVSIEGNVITADLIKTMTQVAGRTRTQFVVTEPTGRTGTFVFWLDVQETAMPDDSEISDTDISMIENAVETVQEAVIEAAEFAQASSDNKEDSEAWAKGTRNGEDVPSTDETYHNNAKYYAEQAAQSASHSGHTIKNENGTAMTARTNLQFANADVEDDAENDCTVVTPRGGTGGSKIVVTTSESSLHNKNVTISDGITTVTEQFSTEGVATFTGITMTGTLTITSTDGTETATDTINVPYYGSYTKAISFVTFNATINISTASTQMQGQTVKVYKNGIQIDTTTFSAGGSATYTAHETGTYKFGCVVDGYEFKSADVVVSAETTYNTTIAYFGATLSITTSSSSLYGKTITIKKGSTTVGTTAFSAQGSATYTVHETGTYTCECEGYSGSATVSAETTYSVTINAGLDLSAWITAGSTTDYPLNPSSYADFSALEADEAAVRQLMTVHASVDYLAQATAGDTLMQSVINSDICAKWINLSDYALDTLSANADIKSVMDEADKYGYGEWGIIDSTTTPPTWGALGNVPIMTANNAPYGVASASSISSTGNEAFHAFDGIGGESTWWSSSTSSTTSWLQYQFVSPTKVSRIEFIWRNDATAGTVMPQISNDGTNFTDLLTSAQNIGGTANQKVVVNIPAEKQEYGLIVRLAFNIPSSGYSAMIRNCQFYGRELTPLVPTMTSNTTPKGISFCKPVGSYGSLSYYAFDKSMTNAWTHEDNTDYTQTSYVGYIFDTPTIIRYLSLITAIYNTARTVNCILQGSDDTTTGNNGTWVDLTSQFGIIHSTGGQSRVKVYTYKPIENEHAYKAYRLMILNPLPKRNDNFYVYDMQLFNSDNGEKEFATGSTRKTIYDHGVELIDLGSPIVSGSAVAEKRGSELYGKLVSGSANGYAFAPTSAIDLLNYSQMRGIAGDEFYTQSSALYPFRIGIKATRSYSNSDATMIADVYLGLPLTDLNITLDISSVTQSAYPMFQNGTSGSNQIATLKEWWLE